MDVDALYESLPDAFWVDEAGLNKFVWQQADVTLKCLRDQPRKSWRPTVAVLVRTSADCRGEIMIFVLDTNFNECDEKRAAIRWVGRQVYEAQKVPVAITISSEAWQSQQIGRSGKRLMEPRHDPLRKETIAVMGMTMPGARISPTPITAITTAAVRRDKKNRMEVGHFGPIHNDCETPLARNFYQSFFRKPMASIVEEN